MTTLLIIIIIILLLCNNINSIMMCVFDPSLFGCFLRNFLPHFQVVSVHDIQLIRIAGKITNTHRKCTTSYILDHINRHSWFSTRNNVNSKFNGIDIVYYTY